MVTYTVGYKIKNFNSILTPKDIKKKPIDVRENVPYFSGHNIKKQATVTYDIGNNLHV